MIRNKLQIKKFHTKVILLSISIFFVSLPVSTFASAIRATGPQTPQTTYLGDSQPVHGPMTDGGGIIPCSATRGVVNGMIADADPVYEYNKFWQFLHVLYTWLWHSGQVVNNCNWDPGSDGWSDNLFAGVK